MPILDQINIQALLCCVELLTYLPVNGKQERREVPPTLKASTKVILFLLFLVTGKYFVRWRPLLVWGVYVSDPDTKHHGTSTISKSVGYKITFSPTPPGNPLIPHSPHRRSSNHLLLSSPPPVSSQSMCSDHKKPFMARGCHCIYPPAHTSECCHCDASVQYIGFAQGMVWLWLNI